MQAPRLLRGTIVNRTYGTHTHLCVCPYFYQQQYLVLFTMFPRNTYEAVFLPKKFRLAGLLSPNALKNCLCFTLLLLFVTYLLYVQ